jgi:hypothetical protein
VEECAIVAFAFCVAEEARLKIQYSSHWRATKGRQSEEGGGNAPP